MRYRRKNFTFAISSPNEFLYLNNVTSLHQFNLSNYDQLPYNIKITMTLLQPIIAPESANESGCVSPKPARGPGSH